MSSIVHCALDVHDESFVAELIKPETGELISERLPHDRQRLLRAAQRWSKLGELRLCYEAGNAGYTIQRWLTEAGYHCEVIAPSLVPKAPGARVKTDKRDARKLVTLYAAGLLQPVHVPTPEDEAVRALVRLRQDIDKDMTRVKNRITRYLGTQGHHYREQKRKWTNKHRAWIRALPLDSIQELIVRTHLEQLDTLAEQHRDIAARIEEIASSERYRDKVGRLMCLRGVKVQSAMGLLMEVDDPRRFTAPQLMSFWGMVPSEHSSGESQQRGGITKAGRSRPRWILGQMAWNQTRKPGSNKRLREHRKTQPEAVVRIAKKAEKRLHEKFWKIAMRKDRKIAATAVAREAVGFVWAILTAEAA